MLHVLAIEKKSMQQSGPNKRISMEALSPCPIQLELVSCAGATPALGAHVTLSWSPGSIDSEYAAAIKEITLVVFEYVNLAILWPHARLAIPVAYRPPRWRELISV